MHIKLKKSIHLLILTVTVLCTGCASYNSSNETGIKFEKAVKTNGILINEVQNGGAIDKAGIREGDIIVSYDGKQISDLELMEKEILDSPPGKKLVLEVMRDEKLFNVSLTFKKKGLKIINSGVSDEFPNYAINLFNDIIWLGTFPYPVDINRFEGILPPHDLLYDPDHLPVNAPTFFTIIVR